MKIRSRKRGPYFLNEKHKQKLIARAIIDSNECFYWCNYWDINVNALGDGARVWPFYHGAT